jgi:hypothetical protein
LKTQHRRTHAPVTNFPTPALQQAVAMPRSRDAAARRRQPGLGGQLLIAVAAVVVIAAAYLFATRSRGEEELTAVDRIASALPADAATSREWRLRPWPQFPVPSHPLSSRGRAVRVGALIIELEALAKSGDSTAARVAGQVSTLLEEMPNGAVAGAAYHALAGAEAVVDTLKRAEAARAVEALAGAPDVRLGAWLEAGRIAAARNDTAFFSRSDTWLTLWNARLAVGDDANSRASVSVLSSYIATPPRDSRRILIALDAVLRALAN